MCLTAACSHKRTQSALDKGNLTVSGHGLRQIVEQRLRLLQIGGVEPVGEPAADGGEEVTHSLRELASRRLRREVVAFVRAWHGI